MPARQAKRLSRFLPFNLTASVLQQQFCLLAIMLLFLQLLSPLAFADVQPSQPTSTQSSQSQPSASASPSPTPQLTSNLNYPSDWSSSAGACPTPSSITDAERETLMQNTLAKPVTELTDMPLEAALQARSNPPTDALNENPAQAKGQFSDPYFQLSIPAAQIEPLLVPKNFKDDAALLAALKVTWDKSTEKPADVLSQIYISPAELRTLGQANGGTAASTTENILTQIGFPSGGKTAAASGPTPTPQPYEYKKIPLPGGKVLTFDQVKASDDLNPNSCLPDGVVNGRVGYMAVLGSDLAYGNLNNQLLTGQIISAPTGQPDEELIDPHGVNQKITGNQLVGFLNLNGGANALVPSFYEYWLVTVQKVNAVQFGLSLFAGITSAGLNKASDKVIALKKDLKNTNIQEIEALSRQTNNLNAQTQINQLIIDNKQLSGDIAYYKQYSDVFNTIHRTFTPVLGTSLMIGFGWIAAGRLLFSANDGLILSTTKNPNEFLKVFVNRPIANRFQQATDPWGLGTAQELLSKYGGFNFGPNKMFNPGPLVFVNYPTSSTADASGQSTTSFASGDAWKIQSNWAGNSIAFNSEDITRLSSRDKFTSLPLFVNELLPTAVINPKVQGDLYTFFTNLGLPFMVFGGLAGEVGRTFAMSGALFTFGKTVKIDPNYGKDQACDKDEMQKLTKGYVAWSIALGVAQIAIDLIPALKASGSFLDMLKLYSRAGSEITAWVNPIQLFQLSWGNKVMTYVSNCRDPQYKILAYQPLSQGPVAQQGTAANTANSVQQTFSSASQLLSNFNLFKSTEATPQIDLSQYQDVLNLQVSINDQQGFISPDSVKRTQIDHSAWMLKGGLFDQLNGTSCSLYENDPMSDGGVLSISRNGIKKTNKDGSTAFDFNSFYWQLRAQSVLRSQELARMIVPNTIITTLLDCGEKPFITINPAGSASLTDQTCPAGNCLVNQLKRLVNFDGTNLDSVVGKVASVETDLGAVSFSRNSISFTRTSLGQIGVEQTAPSLDYLAQKAGVGSTTAGAGLTVLGNANVMLNSPAGDVAPANVGVLRTIIGDKGKIEYDPVAKRLMVFVYVLGSMPGDAVSGVTLTPKQVNEPGKTPIPVINLNVQGKTGFGDLASQINQALKTIQQDSTGAPGGMQAFETPNYAYQFGPGGKYGHLIVTDKKTGAVQDFTLTGNPYRDANGNIVIPTTQGNITFGTGFNAQGQPTLSVNGAGLNDSGTLQAAKGPGGIFTFNPSTGAITVYNGQDIPMNPAFATQGMGFVGQNGQTVGIPADNPFALPAPPSDTGFQSKQNLILPAWPEQAVWFAAMLGVILLGILLVRARKR